MRTDFEAFAIRALNTSRKRYAPTYVGLRLLLDSLPSLTSSDWGSRLVARKLDDHYSWRYRQFSEIKDFKLDRSIEYRDFLYGSPLTVIAESHILQLLSKEPIFAPPNCAYSYLWPQPKSGSNYKYFMEGYKLRNNLVREMLSNNDGEGALVLDIKKFYPSIDQQKLMRFIDGRLGNLKDRKVCGVTRHFITNLVENCKAGIPIGPDLSHFLGHIALERVDNELTKRFGAKYLRYVDDIIILVSEITKNDVIGLVNSLLSKEGLELNDSKTDWVSSETYRMKSPIIEIEPRDTTFNRLLQEMSMYLMIHPSSYSDLKRMFLENGFLLPFLRIKALAKYDRFRLYISIRKRNTLKVITQDKKYLLRKAIELRKNLAQKLVQKIDQPIPEHGIIRRWHVQEIRYCLNRMLYLYNFDEYGKLFQLTPNIDEFASTRTLIEAISKENIMSVLNMPGSVISTFADLWSESEKGSLSLDWNFEKTKYIIDSLATLALYRVIDIPDRFISELSFAEKALVEFCNGNHIFQRELQDLSYLDELRTLQIGKKREELHELLTTRLSTKEHFFLPGLFLGSEKYFS